MDEPIEWRVLHPPTPTVRWGVAALLGLVVGGGLALPAIALVARSDASRPVAAGTLLVLPAVLGGVLSRYRHGRERTPLVDALAVDVAGLRWFPPAGVVVAALVLLVPGVGERTAIHLGLIAVATGAVGFLAVGAVRGSGRFDPEAGTATFDGRLFDLARAPTTPIRFGGLTVLVVRRPAPDPLQRYGILAMPSSTYAEVRRAIPS